MKVLVTGANGLVGQALCAHLNQSEHQVIRAVRTASKSWDVAIGDLDDKTDWSKVLSSDVYAVVHLAGKVPLSSSAYGVQANRYRQVNTLGTANFARQCANYGVKRFIFVSTVKVLGEGQDDPYQINNLAMPADDYAISKWDAEQMLKQISDETGMEVVILRPPLVYGPGVKGNFLHLMKTIDKGVPLPFGLIRNQRSLIYLGNLVDSICSCLTHPGAAGKTFLVSDGEDVSTPELVRRIAIAMERCPFLVSVPISLIRLTGILLGKKAAVNRLLSSLCVDITPVKEELGWIPPYTMEEGLLATVKWYRTVKAIE